MDFVVPGYLGDLRSFEARYGEDADAAAALEPLISPLMLRRRVAEVASDLPERIDIPEFLELGEAEASAYDEMRTAIFEEYGAAATLVSLGKLRQFCAHPGIVDDGRHAAGNEFSKFERLKELLEEVFLRREKALVFTSYTKMADRIAAMAVSSFGAMAATLDGRLDIEDRQPTIDRFSAFEGPAVLVPNPRAGGSGLNITAANHVIHYNPEWNPALEDQASARAHRRGQQRPVTVRRLIYAGTVEEVIDERLTRKRGIADAAIMGIRGREDDYADILTALERSPFSERTART
jgi:SNF2 family DNA or RNA helicase